ncbi:MAG: DNA repair protein RecO [Gemmatimonadota bacterium]|nr:DNA repair protein RecO [Gemmatimonadota bacterium]
MAPIRTGAVLLRAHDYGDSSRILRFYTEGHGLLSVVARGVRGRSGKGTATMATFATGQLTVFVKAHRDLHTMKDFECTSLRHGLGSDVLRFTGASAAAELVLSHAEQETHPGLFEALVKALDDIEVAPMSDRAGTILAGLWTLTEAFGFAPQIDGCIRCGEVLEDTDVGRFDLAAGGVRCQACSEAAAGPRVGPGARRQLRALLRGELPPDLSHTRQHLALLEDFLAYHVISKPLKSLRFLGDLFPREAVVAP